MRDQLPAIEKRPFDGLIFRLNGGHDTFVTKPLDPAQVKEDEILLKGTLTRMTHSRFSSPPVSRVIP